MQEVAAMSQITLKEGVKNGNIDKIKWLSKFQVSNIFFKVFQKTKKHGALRNSISVGSIFFVFGKSKKKILLT